MIGIIGGSGLEDPKILSDFKEKKVSTPFGEPTSAITIGKISGVSVAIISRHGKKHSINPSNVNYRANIWALKELGAESILATTACGSLREEIKPGDFVVPDQFIDRTTKRATTFFDKNKVAHIPMAEPFCFELQKILNETSKGLGFRIHEKGVVVTIEGPRFSTRAESNLFRSWNADIINMSTVPECVLAREAGLCYSVVGMATDYDCWREKGENVNIEMILNTMKQNAERVKKLFLSAIPKISLNTKNCSCAEQIKSAII